MTAIDRTPAYTHPRVIDPESVLKHQLTENGFIGVSILDQTWYGWRAGARLAFQVGTFVNVGHPAWRPDRGAWTAKTLDDAEQMARDYAMSTPIADVDLDDDGIEYHAAIDEKNHPMAAYIPWGGGV